MERLIFKIILNNFCYVVTICIQICYKVLIGPAQFDNPHRYVILSR